MARAKETAVRVAGVVAGGNGELKNSRGETRRGADRGNEPSFLDVDWDVGRFRDGQIQRSR